jgi:hypothetical protein
MHPNQNIAVPTGLAHFELIRLGESKAHEMSAPLLKEAAPHLEFLGVAFATIYEVATCNRKCWGPPHLLESLCARVYNIGISAYLLMERGFYDEALSLIRSAAEIGNFISLVASEQGVVPQWVAADKKTRLREFSPYAIRMRLEKSRGVLVAPEDWYSRFCESYTHATPTMQPNAHNQDGRSWAGGVVQEDGFWFTLDELIGKVGSVAMMAAAFAQLGDSVARLSEMVQTLKDRTP